MSMNQYEAIIEALKIQYDALEKAEYTYIFHPIQDEIRRLNKALIKGNPVIEKPETEEQALEPEIVKPTPLAQDISDEVGSIQAEQETESEKVDESPVPEQEEEAAPVSYEDTYEAPNYPEDYNYIVGDKFDAVKEDNESLHIHIQLNVMKDHGLVVVDVVGNAVTIKIDVDFQTSTWNMQREELTKILNRGSIKKK